MSQTHSWTGAENTGPAHTSTAPHDTDPHRRSRGTGREVYPQTLPTRVDPQTFDHLEAWTAAGIIAADEHTAREAITALRGPDFASPVLETIVRATDRTMRARLARNPSTISRTAVTSGLIPAHHEVTMERLLHDLADVSMGAPGSFQYPAIASRGVLRQLREVGTRALLVAEAHPAGGAGAAIRQANALADDLDALAGQLTGCAARLRENVAPRAREAIAA